jgi:hypothetical protein
MITTRSIAGIVRSPLGADNLGPWSTLSLDKVPTFVDYLSVVFDVVTAAYRFGHGVEVSPLPAICLFGQWPKMGLGVGFRKVF